MYCMAVPPDVDPCQVVIVAQVPAEFLYCSRRFSFESGSSPQLGEPCNIHAWIGMLVTPERSTTGEVAYVEPA